MTIRVVIADDHAMLCDGLKALLEEEAGIEVVGTASDGRQALGVVDTLKPDIVLMDIGMPNLNGIEAASLISGQHPKIRTIILSMHSSAEHVHRAFSAGAHGYLLKESAGRDAISAIQAVQAGKRYVSQPLRDMETKLRLNSHVSSPLERLSVRERQVLQLVAEGNSSSKIASIVHLSPKTVESYRSRMMRKLGVRDVPALVKFALRHGLTTL